MHKGLIMIRNISIKAHRRLGMAFALSILALGSFSPSSVRAATEDAKMFIVIDRNKVQEASTAVKEMQTLLRKKMEGQQEVFLKKAAEMEQERKKLKSLAGSLSPEKLAEKEKEFNARAQKLEQSLRAFQQQVMELQGRLQGFIVNALQKITNDMGNERKPAVIMDNGPLAPGAAMSNPIVWVSPEKTVDLTQEVIDKMNKEFPSLPADIVKAIDEINLSKLTS